MSTRRFKVSYYLQDKKTKMPTVTHEGTATYQKLTEPCSQNYYRGVVSWTLDSGESGSFQVREFNTGLELQVQVHNACPHLCPANHDITPNVDTGLWPAPAGGWMARDYYGLGR